MGFLLLLLLVAGGAGLLWVLGARGALLKLAIAAMMLGGGGYGFQGSPGLMGTGANSSRAGESVSLTKARHAFFGEFNASERWLLISDSYSRRGKAIEAAGVLQNAVRKYPGDLRLWLGYASALVEAGEGMTPAATLAFDRAEALSPAHPATRFFRGLAIARSGDPASGVAMWREALAEAPADASWRPIVEDGVAALSNSAATPPRSN
jgi:cytochrome c-type biogenesis protein CcmH